VIVLKCLLFWWLFTDDEDDEEVAPGGGEVIDDAGEFESEWMAFLERWLFVCWFVDDVAACEVEFVEFEWLREVSVVVVVVSARSIDDLRLNRRWKDFVSVWIFSMISCLLAPNP